MVRIDIKRPVEYSGYEASRYHIEGTCHSEDTKPGEKIAGGSCIVETDSGDVYLYDEKAEQWVLQFSLQE